MDVRWNEQCRATVSFEADYILLTVLSILEQQRIMNLGLCQALIIYLWFRIIRLDRCLSPCVGADPES